MESKKKLMIVMFIAVLFVGLLGSFSISNKEMTGDELIHAVQVQHFLDGESVIMTALTMPITYHLAVFSIAKVCGVTSLFGIRLISCLMIIILLFPIAYLLTKNISKTMQIMFLPVSFIFMFLIYTDLFSLIFILLSFYLMTQRRYVLSGIIGTISVFIRQNNVLWLAFIFIYGLIEFRNVESTYYKDLIRYFFDFLKKNWTFVLGGIIFISFVIYSGGVVQGDVDKHPISFHMGNIYMFLFLFFFCFMPYCLGNLKQIFWFAYKRIWPVVLVALTTIGVLLYESTHPYNFTDGIWFNMLLMNVNADILWRILYLIPILIALLTICATSFENKKVYWMYPITFIVLGLSWLVEIRYSIIPLVFFLIFYKNNKELENITLGYYILLSLAWFGTLLMMP